MVSNVSDETILDFIDGFTDRHGYPPTVRELACGVGFSSPGGMKYRIDVMRNKGMLTYEPRLFRTLRVTRHAMEGDDG